MNSRELLISLYFIISIPLNLKHFGMRIPIFLILVSFSTFCFSQAKKDSLKNKLEPYLSFSLNSNGIAPIPAFSLDKPAIIASVGLTKGRFSYDPGLAYGLDGKVWYID